MPPDEDAEEDNFFVPVTAPTARARETSRAKAKAQPKPKGPKDIPKGWGSSSKHLYPWSFSANKYL